MRSICTTLVVLWLPLSASGATARAEAGCVLVEAEGFAEPGGWVVDPQFMDQMGSPYLLAHGLGRPVADTATQVAFPETGSYRVWVRTKDWVAQWQAPGTPGRFQVLVNGKPLATTFGTEGAQWHWQDGGRVDIPERSVRLALHDLTGFDGRCDALLFSRETESAPPDRDPELAAFRRACLGLPEQPVPAGEFDLVVTGGGIAGICTAISAARLGLQVALVQDRPVLGGNNSSEVRVWLGGGVNKPPYPRIGDIVRELEPAKRAHPGSAEIYEDEKRILMVKAEPNIKLFLDCRVNGVLVDGGSIKAVTAQGTRTGARVRFSGKWFADCTGDATIGFLAGADQETTSKGHMGPSNLWTVKDTGKPGVFPRCPWALNLDDKPFPGRSGQNAQWSKPGLDSLGRWFWECGFDWDPVADREKMRDWNLRAMFGAWDVLKNKDRLYPNHELDWAAYISGQRESRRLLGDVILSREDLVSGKPWADGCFPCTWSLDLHSPNPAYQKGFEANEFISRATADAFPRPYWAPYRCLYSRNISNLFMAGRDISVTHDALGTVRVMRTCGAMGEVVGMAASLCKQHDTTPRAIYQNHLGELQDLMRRGTGRNPASIHPPPPGHTQETVK